MNTSIFNATPAVAVRDARGQSVRNIQYHRHPLTPDMTDTRITRHDYDTRGALSQSADPRLYDAGLANFTCLTDLTGGVLRTDSADAGVTVALSDAAGRPVLAVSATGVVRTWQYEDTSLPGRPLSMTEKILDGSTHITERFVYAINSDEHKGLNLAGQCVSHYDTVGLVQTDSIALTGVPHSATRRLLKSADTPDIVADWQGAAPSVWDNLLDCETYITRSTSDAIGMVLTTTDAAGNMQRMAYDVAGQLKGRWLTLTGGQEQVIITSVSYSAAGQKLREEHGNGVVTTYTYQAQTQRLIGVTTERPVVHTAGAKVLQDLRYEYDPVGNVLKVRNAAEEPRFWRNQEVVPASTYAYDSLYQLVSVAGREQANAGHQRAGQLPSVVILPTDSSTFTNYSRRYTYDAAGNLTQISHRSPAGNNSHTTDITVSDRSNRAVVSELAAAQVEAQFTAGGRQTQLVTGQLLSWNGRGELAQVSPVAGNSEGYRYDSSSQRVLKMSTNNMQAQRVVYLPGLELRSTSRGGKITESLQVIIVGEAGGAQVRVMHWESGKPGSISNNQVRYSYGDLIQSTGLEVDGEGRIISQEEHYPFGGTAVLTGLCAVEVSYKTVRYSGKERDATGLYYYGYRYYQPWAGRWLSADPAGTVDGLNLFRMVRNNPATLRDSKGLAPVKYQFSHINEDFESVNYDAIIYGNLRSASLLFPEENNMTQAHIIDNAQYMSLFKNLTEKERTAVRRWTSLGNDYIYNDQQGDNKYEQVNFELNESLFKGIPLSDIQQETYTGLISAIRLPSKSK